MIYADTSCVVKLLRPEPLSQAVWGEIDKADVIVISALVELETLVQLKADFRAGLLTRAQWRQIEARFAILRNQPPFDFRSLPGAIFQTALRQHRNSRAKHCRSLDRLHLAALEELNLSHLLTHDEQQAAAAIEAGFQVIRPGKA